MKASKCILPMLLVPCLIAATMPAGSLTTFGEATALSGIPVKSGAAVFPGDSIKTGAGGALFTLSDSKSIQIGPNSEVRVGKDSSVEIVSGMSRVQSKTQTFAMLASDWKLQGQPDSKTGVLTADVVRQADGKVSLNVASGQVSARSNRGNVVMVAQVGRPLLLPASIPMPDPPPQGGSSASGGVSKPVIVAAILGAAGLGAGIAAIATQDDNSDLKSQVTSLATQNAALTTQINALRTSLNAVAAAAQQIKGLTDQLNTALANLTNLSNQLDVIQRQINTLVAKVASGQSLTAAEQASLASLQAQQAALAAQITTASNTVNTIITSIKNTVVPTP